MGWLGKVFNKDKDKENGAGKVVKSVSNAVARHRSDSPDSDEGWVKLDRLFVSHELSHTLTDLVALAWDPVRMVVVACSRETLWVFGKGWAQRRYALGENGGILSLSVMRGAPKVLVASPRAITVVDIKTGKTRSRTVRAADAYSFTTATTLVSENWVLCGRTDGSFQALTEEGNITRLVVDIFEMPGATAPDADAHASRAITTLISRMFHKQNVVVRTERSGLIQINYIRREVLNRFVPPKDAVLTCITPCAIDKYILAGTQCGRIVIWKMNDEPKSKATLALPPMMVVPTAAPVRQLECYGSGTEDIIFCRHTAGSAIIDAELRPKDKLPGGAKVHTLHAGETDLDGPLCGVTSAQWPERTRPPAHQMIFLRGGALWALVRSGNSWNERHLAPFPRGVDIVGCDIVQPAADIVPTADRSGFPYRAADGAVGGKDPMSQLALSHDSASRLLVGWGGDGTLVGAKAAPALDFFLSPVTGFEGGDAAAKAPDSPRSPRCGSLYVTPGHAVQAAYGNALLSCADGILRWTDLATMKTRTLNTMPHTVTCACHIASPLHCVFFGTGDGQVGVLPLLPHARSEGVALLVGECVVMSLEKGNVTVDSIAVANVDGVWTITASYLLVLAGNALGNTPPPGSVASTPKTVASEPPQSTPKKRHADPTLTPQKGPSRRGSTEYSPQKQNAPSSPGSHSQSSNSLLIATTTEVAVVVFDPTAPASAMLTPDVASLDDLATSVSSRPGDISLSSRPSGVSGRAMSRTSRASTPAPDKDLPPPLPPRPLRRMGEYVVSDGNAMPKRAGILARSELVCKWRREKKDDGGDTSSTLLTFDAGPRAKPIPIPSTLCDVLVVIKLPAETFSSPEDEGDMRSSLRHRRASGVALRPGACAVVRLKDTSGNDAIVITVCRGDIHGHCSMTIEWRDTAAVPHGEQGTYDVVKSVLGEVVPVAIGKDTVLAARIPWDGDGARVVSFASSDCMAYPRPEEIQSAVQFMSTSSSFDDKPASGQAWKVIESHALRVTADNGAGGHHYAISSAVSEPQGAVCDVAVYEDALDDDPNPDTAPTLRLHAQVKAEAVEATGTMLLPHTKYRLHSLLVKSGHDSLHQLKLSGHKEARRQVNACLSSPFLLRPPTYHDPAERIVAARVADLPNFGTCAFLLGPSAVHVVQLPLSAGVSTPVLSHTSPAMCKLHALAVDVGESTSHVVVFGRYGRFVHIILNQDERQEPPLVPYQDVNDEPGSVHSGGLFANVATEPQRRPQVKAPGMGALTLKGMFRGHDREVAQVDKLVHEIIEETFDDFTARLFTREQREKFEKEREKTRRELLGESFNASSSFSSSFAASPYKSSNAAVNDVKDTMDKNRMLLNERGNKINELGENTKKMESESSKFLASVQEYNKRQAAKKWYQL